VDVRLRANLEGEDQFVPGTIESSHPAIILDPDDQVLQLRIDAFCCLQDLGHMPPVHADEMDRSIDAVGGEVAKSRSKKGDKLLGAHFAGGHGEFAMLDRSLAANICHRSEHCKEDR